MLKEIFHDSFENFEIYKDLYGKLCIRDCGKSCFSHTSAFNLWRPFRFPNFNMFFQLVLTKFFKSELFSFLAKVDHVITVMQIAYSLC